MTITVGTDSAKTRKTLALGTDSFDYYSIQAATDAGLGDFSNLPAVLRVVLENLLRFEDNGKTISLDDIKAFALWAKQGGKNPREIAYRPARILLQDFTGVPAVVDLAAMRDGIVALGGDADKINPLNPVDLVIDHSVMIDAFGTPRAFQMNVEREYERNMERYSFLKWGQKAFDNFRVVPPRNRDLPSSKSGISYRKPSGRIATKMAQRLPTPIHWLARIAIRLWSMASRFWVGESAG